MAVLIIRHGADSGLRRQIGEELIVGRSSHRHSNDAHFLKLSDGEISRRHLRLFCEDGHYYIEDLNSTNGTLMGGKFLQSGQRYPVRDGDEIYLGNTQAIFRLSAVKLSDSLAKSQSGIIAAVPRSTGHELHVMSDGEKEPDISMVVDASKILMQLRDKEAVKHAADTDLIKRMQAMVQVSITLGATTNLDDLLDKISALIFEIFAGAERVFVIACSDNTDEYYPLIVKNRDGEGSMESQSIVLSRSIINTVLMKKQAMLLMDALGDARFSQQDSVMDLAIRSVMCAPLLYEDKVLGLVQVDTKESSSVFSAQDLEILTGISAQMAISMKNSQLYEEIEGLFEGFVKASVQAIEARDPGTAGHSFRVADYTEQLAKAIDRSDASSVKGVSFNRDEIQEIRYAALLHDFGKVGVRENVLTKAKKLYPHELQQLKMRVKYAQTSLERQAYFDLTELFQSNSLSPEEFQMHRFTVEKELKAEINKLSEFYRMISEINEPGFYYDKNKGRLHEVMDYRFMDREHQEQVLLHEFEFSALSYSHGSLNQKERREIESHVSHTFEFLSLIPWTTKFAGIPDIAHAHHEKLDGTGYPQGLVAEQIPVQSRIMTIADIFDALTAGDRPYRDGVTADIALNILENEVAEGKVDEDMFKIFVESESYKIKPH